MFKKIRTKMNPMSMRILMLTTIAMLAVNFVSKMGWIGLNNKYLLGILGLGGGLFLISEAGYKHYLNFSTYKRLNQRDILNLTTMAVGGAVILGGLITLMGYNFLPLDLTKVLGVTDIVGGFLALVQIFI